MGHTIENPYKNHCILRGFQLARRYTKILLNNNNNYVASVRDVIIIIIGSYFFEITFVVWKR